ncbi:MAG: F0F1 ATP synthase subunit alpha [Lentisphaerae bacterium]|nr:F0F1 ATP synthase subunit alpha [Lentisphaerota bacterium]
MSSSLGSSIPLFKLKVEEKGRIKDIKEIIVRIEGLPTCLNGQIVNMGEDVRGIIMGYDERDVLVLILGDPGKLRMGKVISGVSEPFKIPVGESFLGRMVTALGHQCDRGDEIEPEDLYPVFRDSPPITWRCPVDEPLATGTKVVDVMIPLAKGQRQLILGDRMTGKTVISLDAIINQKGKDVICIYCCIGKSVSALEKVMAVLHDKGALEYTVIMVATDASPVGEQYIVPYAASSMADFFATKGHDVLVIFDDLTKHAWAYRQLSLLLDRPPGREAYPGDIFYVQTQLMERAGRFNDDHGGGSMSFIGIAETQQGDLTGYIPSNLASMCDGQICMSSTIFAEGFRPAIDFGLSISILGGRVQPPILKQLSRDLRAQHAQYSEILSLSKLQSGLSGEAEKIVKRGAAITSVLQQGQHEPVSMEEMVLLLYAIQKDYLMDRDADEQERFRKEIMRFARDRDPGLLDDIRQADDLTAGIEAKLEKLMNGYFPTLDGPEQDAAGGEAGA